MVDISKTPSRRTAQDRVTNNRDYVLPRSREDDIPGVEIRADLRSASRGDGGANELRRTLGMVGDATEAYYRADIAKTAEQAEKDYAEGSVDAAAGEDADPEMAKSVAYQRAYFSVTAARRQSEWEAETTQEIDGLINSGATPEDIEAAFTARGREFIQSTTDLYDDAEIHQRTADRLVRWTSERETAATALLKERTDAELISSTQSELQNALQRGEPLDFEATAQPLIEAGLDPVEVKTAIVDSAIAYAIETRNSDVLYELLDSRG